MYTSDMYFNENERVFTMEWCACMPIAHIVCSTITIINFLCRYELCVYLILNACENVVSIVLNILLLQMAIGTIICFTPTYTQHSNNKPERLSIVYQLVFFFKLVHPVFKSRENVAFYTVWLCCVCCSLIQRRSRF